MTEDEVLAQWLQSGRYREAVTRAIRKPMPATEILQVARLSCPKIRLRDVWRATRELQARGILFCLNPDEVTGRLYYLTDPGRELSRALFATHVERPPDHFDWDLYAKVVRASARKAVLLEIRNLELRYPDTITASLLKKSLRDRYPIALNLVIDCLRDITRLRLVQRTPHPDAPELWAYHLSAVGSSIVNQIAK